MAKNPNQPSRRRYRALLEDVEKRVAYALYSGKLDNPYEAADKRFERFTRRLRDRQFVAAELAEMCEVMGTDTRLWQLRKYPDPGPVKPLEQLI
jgi:hypothetical protein